MLNRSRDWFLLNTCFQAGNISLRASSKSSAQCGVYMYMAARNVYPNPPKVTADKRDTFVDMFQRIVMSTRSPCPENTTMVDEEDQEEQTCSSSLESPDIQAGANPSGSLPTGANLTKSRFMLGTRCSKALWLTEHADHFQAVRDAVQQEKQSRKLLRLDGYVVEARAREFLVQQFTREMATRRSSSNSVTPRDHSDPGAIAVVTIKERRQAESIDATRCAIRNPSIQVIHEAAFAYAGLYVRVDVLRRDPDHPHRWQMYEIKSRVVPSANKIPLHMDLIEDLAVQFFVVSRSILTLYGIPIRPNMSPWKHLLRKVQLVLLNGEYTARADISDATRAEPSSSPPLFVSREYFPFVCHEEVAKYVSTKSTQLRAVTSIPIEKKELLDVPIGAQCTFRNFRCPMLQRVCQPDSTNSSAHSVFTIPRLSLDMKNMLWSAGLQSCTEPGFLDKARRALGSEAEATAMNSSAQLYVELLQEMGKHSATTHRGKYRSVKLNIPLSEGASSPSVADTVFFVHERDFPVVMKRLNEAAVNPAKVRVRSKKPRMDSTNAVPCVPTRFYIDFETVKLPVPIWDGTRPWANIPFQVSLHVEEAQHPHGSVLRHYSYLHMDRGIDPRSDPRPALRNFLEPLLRHLWDTSTPPKDLLIAHYASFERNILVDLFQLDANQSKRLDQSIWDLEKMFRFTTGSGVTVYHPQLLGLSSLKRVQPILAPDLSYNPKGITNGEQATYSYRKWIEEGVFHQAAREHLEEYCTLDTLIMVRCVQNLMNMNAQLEAISE